MSVRREVQRIVTARAEQLAKDTGAACAVALTWHDAGDGAMTIGAWTPDLEVLELLLEKALRSIRTPGAATVHDLRKSRS
ncbi:MAG TPA: hypothetical protein VE261_01595 [Gaiellaceae bacterium]|jgi:hypothetical protein|nr:hypothetical protein [Gaiellaceae bacterium]